jgi:hypothetical protein
MANEYDSFIQALRSFEALAERRAREHEGRD